MKKSVYVFGMILVALILSAYFMFVKRDTHKYDFRFDKVSQGDLMVYVTATGTISAVISVDVGTQVSGIVTKLYADFNSVVKEGQVIARIDTTFLYQSLKDAEANLDRAQAQLNDSKRNLVREKALLDRGLDSQLNYDAVLTTNESNQAAFKSAQATLDRARINLAYATIYAPIDGVVVNRAVNVGQTVAASFSSPTLFTIANDLKRMQVQTTVDESDVGRISIGQEATFTVDAYADETFKGRVSQIRLAPQSIQNVVNYIVIIDVENDQLKLMPGMTANVKILVASASNVLRISNMALRFQPPADLVDTTGSGGNGMRGGFGGRGGGGGEMGGNSMATGDSSTPGRGGMGQNFRGGGQDMGGGDMQAGMERFRVIRDSIQAAHGGKLSQDELRQEMRKLFAGRTPQQQARPTAEVKPKTGTAGGATKFGIVSNFPEYQKSAYNPAHQSGRGRVWILKPSGMLEQIFVRTGLNDGRYTEITSPRLKPGDQVVLGASSSSDSGTEQTRSPLSGQGGGRMGGGGFR